MDAFLELIFSFPTAIYSVLLSVVLIYWVMAILGVIDFDHGHFHAEIHHADAHEFTSFATYAVALGLDGVPFSIVVSLLAFFGWFVSATAHEFLLPLIPLSQTVPFSWAAGLAVLSTAFVVSLPLTALTIRPLRRIFVIHTAPSNASLVGQACRIVTLNVDEKFGRAEVETGGMSHNIRVWAKTPNTLAKGTIARVIDYDAGAGRYEVVAEN